jgi:hypothetical protein
MPRFKYLWLIGTLILSSVIAALPASAEPKLDECRVSQLKVTLPDWEDCCGLGHQAKVVQVNNATQQPCQLTGAPHLRLLDASGHPIDIPVCPNCSDYTFQAKPAQPVVLRHGETAYFLLGYTVDVPKSHCGKVTRLEVLSADGKSFRLDFNKDAARTAPVCDFNVSAWRPGPFQPDAAY